MSASNTSRETLALERIAAALERLLEEKEGEKSRRLPTERHITERKPLRK